MWKYGKWALIAFILFEISQIIIGVCIGIYAALEITGF